MIIKLFKHGLDILMFLSTFLQSRRKGKSYELSDILNFRAVWSKTTMTPPHDKANDRKEMAKIPNIQEFHITSSSRLYQISQPKNESIGEILFEMENTELLCDRIEQWEYRKSTSLNTSVFPDAITQPCLTGDTRMSSYICSITAWHSTRRGKTQLKHTKLESLVSRDAIVVWIKRPERWRLKPIGLKNNMLLVYATILQ